MHCGKVSIIDFDHKHAHITRSVMEAGMKLTVAPVPGHDDLLAIEGELDAADLTLLADALDALEHNEASEREFAKGGGGNDYCVTCTKPGPNLGKKTTVRAGNAVFAFAKGVRLCGTGFSITKGVCR
jgi:hypothetical protein